MVLSKNLQKTTLVVKRRTLTNMNKNLTDIEEVIDLVDEKKLKKLNEEPSYENYRHRKKNVQTPIKPGSTFDDEDSD